MKIYVKCGIKDERDNIIISNIRDVTDQDINKALLTYINNNCDHSIITNENSFLLDVTKCAICDKILDVN